MPFLDGYFSNTDCGNNSAGGIVKIYGIRYRYVDTRTTEDFLYPVVFTSEEKAQAWIDGHPTASNYMSIQPLTLDPAVGVL